MTTTRNVCGLQSVMSSAQSLSDISDERVVPVDYLGVLILLFLFMVLDRLFYTLGLHLGKVPFSLLPCPFFLCPALPCPALPCPALPCPAPPCPALPCPALPSSALPCPSPALPEPCLCPTTCLRSICCQLFNHYYTTPPPELSVCTCVCVAQQLSHTSSGSNNLIARFWCRLCCCGLRWPSSTTTPSPSSGVLSAAAAHAINCGC